MTALRCDVCKTTLGADSYAVYGGRVCFQCYAAREPGRAALAHLARLERAVLVLLRVANGADGREALAALRDEFAALEREGGR
jgi:recombinational DNA repair protein (RecF pathway)